MIDKPEVILFKPNSIFVMKEAESISPKWWHKLIFWKKWNYQNWKIKREYKSLSEMMGEV